MEMQIKTTMRYHFFCINMATRVYKQRQKITSVGKAVENLELLNSVSGNVKWYSCCRKQYVGFSKK